MAEPGDPARDFASLRARCRATAPWVLETLSADLGTAMQETVKSDPVNIQGWEWAFALPPGQQREGAGESGGIAGRLRSLPAFRNPGALAGMAECMSVGPTESLLARDRADRVDDCDRYLFLRKTQSRRWAQEVVMKGIAFARERNFAYAMKCYSDALELDPSCADALVARGAARANQKDYAAAVKDFDDALRLDPAHANALRYRDMTVERLRAARGESSAKPSPSSSAPSVAQERSRSREIGAAMRKLDDPRVLRQLMAEAYAKRSTKHEKNADRRHRHRRGERDHSRGRSRSSSSDGSQRSSTRSRSRSRKRRRRHRHRRHRRHRRRGSSSASSTDGSSDESSRSRRRSKRSRRRRSSSPAGGSPAQGARTESPKLNGAVNENSTAGGESAGSALGVQ